MKNYQVSKINALVLRGLIAEDQELFLNRLNVLISRMDDRILPQLAEGVVVAVKVADEAKAIEYLQNLNKSNSWEIAEITSLTPELDGRIRVSYRYLGRVRWFKSQEDAERFAKGYSVPGVDKQDEEHQFESRYSSTSSDSVSVQGWMDVEYL